MYDRHYQFKCVYVERDFLNEANNKVELGEFREYLENVDFTEVYDAMEDIKPALYFYRNDEELEINSIRYSQLFYEGISVNYNTHLKLYIALNGVADTESIIDIQILINNSPIEFTPKHKVNIGNNVIGIPLAIPALQGGQAYYVSVQVKTDKGKFIIPQWNAQVFAEGVGLGGGTSAENPHIEAIQEIKISDHIDLFEWSKGRDIVTNIATQNPAKDSLVQTIRADIESMTAIVSNNVVITLE